MVGNLDNFRKDLVDNYLNLGSDKLKINNNISTDFLKKIYKHIVSNKKILIVGDYDADGMLSAISLSMYLKLLEKRVKGNFSSKVDTFFNKREFGYEIPKSKFNDFSSNYDLIVMLDTGATYSYFNKDTENVLVIDHHPNNSDELPFVYNPNKNNDISTSTGRVIYEMIASFEEEMRDFFGKDKIKPHDLLKIVKIYAGITLCSDMAEITYDNKRFLQEALELLSDNKTKLIFSKSIPKKHDITTTDISFNLINLINAYSRMGKDLKDIENLFNYYTNSKNILSPCSSKEQEKILKSMQENNNKKKDLLHSLELSLKDRLDNIVPNKDILAIVVEENCFPGLNGLLSQNILNNYRKSNLVLSYDENRKLYVGSGRGENIKQSLELLVNNNLNLKDNVTFGGHEEAVGLTVNKDFIDMFLNEYNKLDIKLEKNKDLNVYKLTLDEFKEAKEYYSLKSPTTPLNKKFYSLLENYSILSDKIFTTKTNHYSATLIDDSSMLTIYFDEKTKDKLLNNEPILLEITNDIKGTVFIRDINYDTNNIDLSQSKEIKEIEEEQIPVIDNF